jgi:hypothetical protein
MPRSVVETRCGVSHPALHEVEPLTLSLHTYWTFVSFLLRSCEHEAGSSTNAHGAHKGTRSRDDSLHVSYVELDGFRGCASHSDPPSVCQRTKDVWAVRLKTAIGNGNEERPIVTLSLNLQNPLEIRREGKREHLRKGPDIRHLQTSVMPLMRMQVDPVDCEPAY